MTDDTSGAPQTPLAVPGTSSSPPARSSSPWIQSAPWDLFWIFSALWGGALVLLGMVSTTVMGAALFLFGFKAVVAACHAWSTTYMMLASPLLEEERRANRWRYTWAPAGIVLAALSLGVVVAETTRFPTTAAPGVGLWAFWLYVGSFMIGHFWHFGNQDFGVLSLYRARAGQTRAIDRRADKLFTATMMFAIQPVVYLSLFGTTAFSEIVWKIVPISREHLATAALVAVTAAVALSLLAMAFELSKPNRSLPKLLYIFVCLLHPTLPYAAVAFGQQKLVLLYLVAYLWSHWLIATGLVGRLNTRFYESQGSTKLAAAMRHTVVLALTAGVVLLALLPFTEYAILQSPRYEEVLASITAEQTLLIGLVLGFFLAEQLLHYYCDRCLFRFRTADVRRKVEPLLMGVGPAR